MTTVDTTPISSIANSTLSEGPVEPAIIEPETKVTKKVTLTTTNITSKVSDVKKGVNEQSQVVDDVLKMLADDYDENDEEMAKMFSKIREILTKRLAQMKPQVVVQAATGATATVAAVAAKPRKTNSYNQYIKHRFAETKAIKDAGGVVGESKDLMGIFAKEWKLLSKEEQQPFIDQANEIDEEATAAAAASPATTVVGVTTVKKTSGPRAMSGYNLYVQNNCAQVKTDNPGMDGAARKTLMAAEWKALSDDEKKQYSAAAKALFAAKTN